MYALTIWQPWASLIVGGAKEYEFRVWRAHEAVIGQRIAIHAATRAVKRDELLEVFENLRAAKSHGRRRWAGINVDQGLTLMLGFLEDPAKLPRAAVIGTAVLGEPIKPVESRKFALEEAARPSEMDPSIWAWPMLDVRAVELFPFVGRQGLWHCPYVEPVPEDQ